MRRVVVFGIMLLPLIVPTTASAVDTSPPKTRITAGPNGPTSDATPVFRFKSSEKGSRFKCRVDSRRLRACTSPRTLRHLSEGTHTFSVVAIDKAGNKDRSPAKRSFVVDTTPPSTAILSGPAEGAIVRADGSAFTFGSSETGASFACRLDVAAFGACGATRTYPGLADGSHTLWVVACDLVGNCDATPAVRTWTVDTSPPLTTIDSGPTADTTTSDNDPSFTFSADPALGVTFECKLDAADFATCSSPMQYVDLADGPHTFAVRACDAVGNCDATPAIRSWTVGSVQLDTVITGGPIQPTTPDNVAVFTFTGTPIEDVHAFECSLDGGPYTTCSSGINLTVSRNVLHSFRVKACDAVDACDTTPAEWLWTVTEAAFLPQNETDSPREADFCQVQFPLAATVAAGQQLTVYGRVFEDGITQSAGASGQVSAQLGLGPSGSDPRTAPGWSFATASFNVQVGNNDEYAASFNAPATAGSYDYLFRFSFDGGNTATYCDVNGSGSAAGATFEPGAQSGQLTVSP